MCMYIYIYTYMMIYTSYPSIISYSKTSTNFYGTSSLLSLGVVALRTVEAKAEAMYLCSNHGDYGSVWVGIDFIIK